MERKMKPKRFNKKWLWLVFLVPVLALSGFVIWAETASEPMPEAQTAMQSNAQVRVITSPWLTFQPVDVQATTGLIFYPGGRVVPGAYAPAAQAIADQGYLVVIVPMPLNLAVLSPDRAQDVIAAHPEIQDWAVGGHSLGGAMAANYAQGHPAQVQGLVLWASYPASSDNLSTSDLRVVSIYGTQDGLATGEKIDASRALLPTNTQWVAIEGGNHAQFGWYGPQSGDNPASISREKQQQEVIAATVDFLKSLDK
jgi:hypothetical protein